jgi:hypothetical protein
MAWFLAEPSFSRILISGSGGKETEPRKAWAKGVGKGNETNNEASVALLMG